MQVKVWNKNVFDYKEKFRGENIEIPAGKFIVMDDTDAHNFKTSFSPRLKDADGNDAMEGFKMLFIEPIGPAKETVIDKEAWGKEMEEMHAGKQQAFDEAAEAEIKARKKK